MINQRGWRLGTVGLLAFFLALGPMAAEAGPRAESQPEPQATAFKIYVARSGAYQVTFKDLVDAGLTAPSLPSSSLELTHLGESVPIWVEDSGDGRFDPGDRIEFLGTYLAGEVSYFNEVARYNVYRLRTDAAGDASGGRRRMTPRAMTVESTSHLHALRRKTHHEEDVVFIRLPTTARGPEELWFWAKLVRGNKPFAYTLDLSDLDRSSEGTVDLSLQFRGWSRPRHKGDAEIADHRVDVALNGTVITSSEWNGADPHRLELTDLPSDLFIEGENLLELSVPKREQADGEILVDVVLLNWIEVASPRHHRIGEHQALLSLADPAVLDSAELDSAGLDSAEPGRLQLVSDSSEELLVYAASGWRASSDSVASASGTNAAEFNIELDVSPPEEDEVWIATRASGLAPPVAVVVDRPSRLSDPATRADYIMITHRRLQEAIEPLAEFHRDRGLAVTVVDVEDVYDEFSHGVRDPQAIRRFLGHAHDHWAKPSPRFVLLVGDASWDVRNEVAVDANYADWTFRPFERDRFVKNGSTPYDREIQLNHRNYIPTLGYSTYEGHAASDNGFVTLVGDDSLPDMAIGRFPVTEPSEVADIVAKTIGYISRPESGAWRKRVLFITSETPSFQRNSDRVANFSFDSGFEPFKVYPASSETSNEHHTARLLEAFDEGALFVHFYGHGGRYIWRTGPPDLKKNHDLLTLDHLDQLAPTSRLPVVLSMTCYSAPFDHPSADSIGEKFLRVAERGAVGVIAASWRNGPRPNWGQTLLEELTSSGATVGEALMRAKHRIRSPMFIHTYNLLGDPAVPVALLSGGEVR